MGHAWGILDLVDGAQLSLVTGQKDRYMAATLIRRIIAWKLWRL